MAIFLSYNSLYVAAIPLPCILKHYESLNTAASNCGRRLSRCEMCEFWHRLEQIWEGRRVKSEEELPACTISYFAQNKLRGCSKRVPWNILTEIFRVRHALWLLSARVWAFQIVTTSYALRPLCFYHSTINEFPGGREHYVPYRRLQLEPNQPSHGKYTAMVVHSS